MSDCWVGLTGGIGCGKSAAAVFFDELGAAVVDADAVVAELTGASGAALPVLRREVGAWVLDADGNYNRPLVRRRVFADASARRRLEGVLHPMTRELMQQRLAAAAAPYAVAVVPLLFESAGWDDMFCHIVVVDCAPQTQIARAAARDGTADIQKIIAAQMPAAQRRRRADTVIDNDGDLAALQQAVARLHKKLLRRAAPV